MAEHPGIVFKDGPTGRRAALMLGPDVWELVKAAREVDERAGAAVDAVAELANLTREQVEVALRYYAAYAAEIDEELCLAEEESASAEQQWRTRQHLLA